MKTMKNASYKGYGVRKNLVAMIFIFSLLLMAVPERIDTKAEESNEKKVITIGTLQIDEETEYSFQNAYATTYDDGWYMNVKGGKSANGTQVNVYQLDMTQPVTQRFKFTIIDEKEGVVRISPAYAEDKYLDVRRYGKPFVVGQKIALWEDDNDPLKLKDIYLDFQEDGSFYLTFNEYGRAYCIAPSSKGNAQKAQQQLVVRDKSKPSIEMRWYLCDKYGTRIEFDLSGNIDSKPYEEVFGVPYKDMFENYASALNNETFDNLLNTYFEQCDSVLDNVKPEVKIFGWTVFGVPEEKIEQVNALYTDASDLRIEILQLRNKFGQDTSVSIEEITNYESRFSDYLLAVKDMLEGTKQIVNHGGTLANLNNSVKQFDALVNYEHYIELCLNSAAIMRNVYVTEQMELLLEKLENQKYFTKNSLPCNQSKRLSGHGCDNCSIQNIINMKNGWFVELFGKISLEQLPSHNVNGTRRTYNGKSCFGFACFAQWFVFRSDNADVVDAERIAAGTFDKEFVQEHVLPGDVLRINNAHSVLVYEVTDEGIVVIDSNWNGPGQLNCVVQKHVIKYSDTYYAETATYVNRVLEYEINEGE